MSQFDKSLFKNFFESTDATVAEWTENVLEKMRLSGVAKYIKRFSTPDQPNDFDKYYKPIIKFWAYFVKLSVMFKTFRDVTDRLILFAQQYMTQNGYYISFRETAAELRDYVLPKQHRFSAYRGTENSYVQEKRIENGVPKVIIDGELIRLYGYNNSDQFAPFVAGIAPPQFNGLCMDRGGSLYRSLEMREDLNIINPSMDAALFDPATGLFKRSKENGYYYEGSAVTAGDAGWSLTANLDSFTPYVFYFEIECVGIRVSFKVKWRGTEYFFEGKTPPIPPGETKSFMRFMFNVGNYVPPRQLQLPRAATSYEPYRKPFVPLYDPNPGGTETEWPETPPPTASAQPDIYRYNLTSGTQQINNLPQLIIPPSGTVNFGIAIAAIDAPQGASASDYLIKNIRLTPLRTLYGRSFIDVRKVFDICTRNKSTVYSDEELADIVRQKFVPYNTAFNAIRRWERARTEGRGIGFDIIEENFEVG